MAEQRGVQILGISGSLRRASYNTRLLHAAGELLPAGMTLELFDLAPIPVYDEDVRSAGVPAPVQALREKIAGADALLIATPEYNYSPSGVLKNAIDWASRPPSQPFSGKPGAILGASTGLSGTIRAQLHLRQVLGALNTLLVNTPHVAVAGAAPKFDETGRLTDEPTRQAIQALLVALDSWTRRLRG